MALDTPVSDWLHVAVAVCVVMRTMAVAVASLQREAAGKDQDTA